ncbi:unnamed protein product [Bursaphelenchus okinawaensis]|uniref:Cytochrome P450 n=1 Tax=Bursaphelenchus okinawaensis TaxID=465554 RepID=A0A811L9T1_9BILA|nr:unnamed protein product [Bursaphelenchus okinawaensis]CAG9119463.1 unnamed protein product [Bursaphelenchus okinawaensis]
MALFFTVVIALVCLWVIHAIYHSYYWRRRNVPGPKSYPIVGNLLEVGWNSICYTQMLTDWSKKYGGYYGLQKGAVNLLVVSDPKLVKEVLVEKFNVFHDRRMPPCFGEHANLDKSDVFFASGIRWKRIRTLINPLFSSKNLKRLIPMIQDSAEHMIEHIEKRSNPHQSVDIKPYSFEMAMDAMCRIAYGHEKSMQFDNPVNDQINYFVRHPNDFPVIMSWIFPAAWRLFYVIQIIGYVITQTGRGAGVFKVKNLIKERQKQMAAGEEGHEDFISFFMESMDKDIQIEKTTVFNQSEARIINKKLTEGEVENNSLLFLLAGPDAIGNTNTFLMYYMAKDPDVQEKIRKEIEETCVESTTTFEELGKLRYTEAAIKETLRLQPIASGILTRRCTNDTKLSNGLLIEAGTAIELDIPSVHHNKEIYGEDAVEFRPERFLENSYADHFYGFGGGPRICMGMRLGYIIQKLMLIRILKRYRIRQAKDTEDFEYVGPMTYSINQMKVILEDL